jgi:hypothetical protein
MSLERDKILRFKIFKVSSTTGCVETEQQITKSGSASKLVQSTNVKTLNFPTEFP